MRRCHLRTTPAVGPRQPARTVCAKDLTSTVLLSWSMVAQYIPREENRLRVNTPIVPQRAKPRHGVSLEIAWVHRPRGGR